MGWSNSGWTTGGPDSMGGLWATPLMENYITSQSYPLGVRVHGLTPGTYQVYGLDSIGTCVNMNSYGALGMNIDSPSTTVTQTMVNNAPTSWVNGQSDIAATLTVTSTSDWVTFVTYATNNNSQFSLQGMQIVQVAPLYTWTGGGTAVWSDSRSWTPAGVPPSNTPVMFNNNVNTTISLDGNRTVAAMIFDSASAGAFTFNNNTLTLAASGSITVNSTVTTDQTFNSVLALAGSAALANNGGGNLIFNGGIVRRGQFGHANADAGRLGSGSIGGTIGNGASGGCCAGGARGLVEPFRVKYLHRRHDDHRRHRERGHPPALQNTTVSLVPGGALSFAAGNTSALLGGLSNNADLALTTAASEPVALSVGNNSLNSVYGGVMSGTGSLTKVGSGMFTLTNAFTYQGPRTSTPARSRWSLTFRG